MNTIQNIQSVVLSFAGFRNMVQGLSMEGIRGSIEEIDGALQNVRRGYETISRMRNVLGVTMQEFSDKGMESYQEGLFEHLQKEALKLKRKEEGVNAILSDEEISALEEKAKIGAEKIRKEIDQALKVRGLDADDLKDPKVLNSILEEVSRRSETILNTRSDIRKQYNLSLNILERITQALRSEYQTSLKIAELRGTLAGALTSEIDALAKRMAAFGDIGPGAMEMFSDKLGIAISERRKEIEELGVSLKDLRSLISDINVIESMEGETFADALRKVNASDMTGARKRQLTQVLEKARGIQATGLEQEIRAEREVNIRRQAAEEAGPEATQEEINKIVEERIKKLMQTEEVQERINSQTINMSRLMQQLRTDEAKLLEGMSKAELEILNIIKQSISPLQTRSELYSQETEMAEKLVGIMDSYGMGIGASVEMRMKAIDALGQEIKITEDMIKTQRAMAEEAGQEESEEILKEINKLELKRMNLIQKQVDLSKALREGWISAINSMMVGTNRLAKIAIDQTKNMGMAVQYLDVTTSHVSGSARGGMRRPSRFQVNPMTGQVNLQGEDVERTGMPYEISYGANRDIAREVRERARRGSAVEAARRAGDMMKEEVKRGTTGGSQMGRSFKTNISTPAYTAPRGRSGIRTGSEDIGPAGRGRSYQARDRDFVVADPGLRMQYIKNQQRSKDQEALRRATPRGTDSLSGIREQRRVLKDAQEARKIMSNVMSGLSSKQELKERKKEIEERIKLNKLQLRNISEEGLAPQGTAKFREQFQEIESLTRENKKLRTEKKGIEKQEEAYQLKEDIDRTLQKANQDLLVKAGMNLADKVGGTIDAAKEAIGSSVSGIKEALGFEDKKTKQAKRDIMAAEKKAIQRETEKRAKIQDTTTRVKRETKDPLEVIKEEAIKIRKLIESQVAVATTQTADMNTLNKDRAERAKLARELENREVTAGSSAIAQAVVNNPTAGITSNQAPYGQSPVGVTFNMNFNIEGSMSQKQITTIANEAKREVEKGLSEANRAKGSRYKFNSSSNVVMG
jgi:hypothetical protein